MSSGTENVHIMDYLGAPKDFLQIPPGEDIQKILEIDIEGI